MRMPRHLTELSTDLGIGILQSSLLLGSFIGVSVDAVGKRGLSDDLYECKLKLLIG
jgi:hypothetical protein